MLSCLSLLLAVTTVAQAAPTPAPRAHRRQHPLVAASTIAPLISAADALDAAAMPLIMAQPDIQVIAAQAPMLAMTVADAVGAIPVITAWGLDDVDDLDEPDEPDFAREDAATQADVADSLYRAARQALNGNQYQRAADLFRSIRDRYPRSTYVPNTYYWQSFALYRTGSEDALREARTALGTQLDRYPKATTRRDAQVLLRRVQGELARMGDPDAAAAVSAAAEAAAPPTVAPVPGTPPMAPIGPVVAGTPGESNGSESCDDDDDIRIAALNAVLQMDADRAVPLLKSVLARRDAGSTCLRRKAVFLVSQKRSDETSRILLDVVRSDPDKEVREQAVFWLSQVPGDETVAALDSILRDPKTDPEIQEKAIFALSQHRSARAGATLRDFAARRDANGDLREKAIFWIGQNRSPDNAQFLKDLYTKVENDDLKEKIIFSLSQMGGADNYRWLMDIALNAKEDIEIRKKALFWAGQGHSVDVADLVRLYDSMNDREMKEQLIFVYSQRREDAALDKLFQIGKNDPDRELRKKAIFWIGQSRSPRAAQYLQDLINQ